MFSNMVAVFHSPMVQNRDRGAGLYKRTSSIDVLTYSADLAPLHKRYRLEYYVKGALNQRRISAISGEVRVGNSWGKVSERPTRRHVDDEEVPHLQKVGLPERREAGYRRRHLPQVVRQVQGVQLPADHPELQHQWG